MSGSETGAEGEGEAAAEAEAEAGLLLPRWLRLGRPLPCMVLLHSCPQLLPLAALRHWFVWWFVAGLRRRRRFSAVASSKQAGTCPDQPNLPQQPVPWSQLQLQSSRCSGCRTAARESVQSRPVLNPLPPPPQLPSADEGRLMTPSQNCQWRPPSPRVFPGLAARPLQLASRSINRGTKTPRARPAGHSPEAFEMKLRPPSQHSRPEIKG